MKPVINQKKSSAANSNIGLRVVFSEKAIAALLYVVLVLGLAYFQSNRSVLKEAPVKELQNEQSSSHKG